jgi:multidrug resistance efflux pump
MDWSAAEALLVITQVGTAVRWWLDRRDARSALATAKSEADKTIARWERTSADKDATIAELKEDRQRKEERIAHLESLVYAKGSG